MRSIKKDFFGNQVLTDISFTLREGEVLGLVGENGAGKSTLMKILFGMDVIRETGGYGGDVLINGEKVTFNTPFDALAAGIGMVHQEFSLIPGFTATENILLNREPQKKNVISEVFGSRLNTLDYKEMDRSAAAAIEKMGVHIDANMVISDMPVGHKQFTEIARELSKEHLKLLILDEPTVGLDPLQIIEIRELVRELGENHTVILSSHILSEISAVCDYVIIIAHGEIVASDTIENLTTLYAGKSIIDLDVRGGRQQIASLLEPYAEITSHEVTDGEGGLTHLRLTLDGNEDIRESLFYRFADAHVPILSMQYEEVTLEKVFLSLTEEKKPEEETDSDGTVDVFTALHTESVAEKAEADREAYPDTEEDLPETEALSDTETAEADADKTADTEKSGDKDDYTPLFGGR